MIDLFLTYRVWFIIFDIVFYKNLFIIAINFASLLLMHDIT